MNKKIHTSIRKSLLLCALLLTIHSSLHAITLQYSATSAQDATFKESMWSEQCCKLIDDINEVLVLNGQAAPNTYAPFIIQCYNYLVMFTLSPPPYWGEKTHDVVLPYLGAKIDDLIVHFGHRLTQLGENEREKCIEEPWHTFRAIVKMNQTQLKAWEGFPMQWYPLITTCPQDNTENPVPVEQMTQVLKDEVRVELFKKTHTLIFNTINDNIQPW